LFMALTQFFTGLASKQPILLTIEDLHWSDETSLEFLHYLARRCAAHPLLIVMIYRHDEIHSELRHWLAQLNRERLAQEVFLPPLSRGEVEAMLQAIFESNLSPDKPSLRIPWLISCSPLGSLVRRFPMHTRQSASQARLSTSSG
jgi:predicted ATPase